MGLFSRKTSRCDICNRRIKPVYFRCAMCQRKVEATLENLEKLRQQQNAPRTLDDFWDASAHLENPIDRAYETGYRSYLAIEENGEMIQDGRFFATKAHILLEAFHMGAADAEGDLEAKREVEIVAEVNARLDSSDDL